MSAGGRLTQLSFDYQNKYCLLQILKEIQRPVFRIEIEQKLAEGDGREVDMRVWHTDKRAEVHEIKAGVTIRQDKTYLRETVMQLYDEYVSTDRGTILKTYTLVIEPGWEPELHEFMGLIGRLKTYLPDGVKFAKCCKDSGIQVKSLTDFSSFVKVFSPVESPESYETICREIELELRTITKDIFENADHGIPISYLVNNLIAYLLSCLRNSDGVLNLTDLAEIISDWCRRNLLASETGPSGKDLAERREKIKAVVQSVLKDRMPNIIVKEEGKLTAPVEEGVTNV